MFSNQRSEFAYIKQGTGFTYINIAGDSLVMNTAGICLHKGEKMHRIQKLRHSLTRNLRVKNPFQNGRQVIEIRLHNKISCSQP